MVRAIQEPQGLIKHMVFPGGFKMNFTWPLSTQFLRKYSVNQLKKTGAVAASVMVVCIICVHNVESIDQSLCPG